MNSFSSQLQFNNNANIIPFVKTKLISDVQVIFIIMQRLFSDEMRIIWHNQIILY